MEINILHLSDLHFNKRKERDIEIVLEAFKKDFIKQEAVIDFIFFNGDLVNSGESLENFQYAKEKFIMPLLELTNLTENEFFIVPGNHEVNRNSISEFIDKDLSKKFPDRDSVNRFIDSIEKQKQLLNRLDNYNSFLSDFHSKSTYINSQNPLFNTYILPVLDKKIGIACLNSAWCSEGDQDYGQMLIGERQIDDSLKSLKDVDYKIAMVHHPLEWLKEYDRDSINDVLITGFDMLLTGHVHSQNYKEHAYDNHNTVFLKTAPLFQGRTYNGYSLLKLNLFTKDLKVIFREYFEGGRRVFGKAERVADEGEKSFNLTKDKDDLLIKSVVKIKQELKKKAALDINNKLLSVSSDSLAPKEITKIFVNPILTTQPEKTSKANKEILDEKDIVLEDVLSSSKSIFFIGKKETGKTTLLNYIFNAYLSKYEKLKIPVIIDFENLPGGNNVFHKATQNFLINYNIQDSNMNKNFELGNYVFLIDNFSLKKEKSINRLKEFATKYPNNRFLFTMNEDMLQTMQLKDWPELGFEYDSYYINTFNRSQVRDLVKKWFSFQNVNDDIILDRVITSMKSIGVPRTPMFISLMLWILEKQSNFIPVNEASLIENFIETLLEKLKPDEAKYETLGYKIKKDFLTFIAKYMIDSNQYHISISDFEKRYVEYFTSKGLEVSSILKQNFFDKGILISVGNSIYFRFSCFLEYFVALEMEEDNIFFEHILDEKNYLDFTNEIIYYTGLNQKKKSFEVLKIIEERLLKNFKEIDNIVNLDDISILPIEEVLFTDFKNGVIHDRVAELKLSEEEKDVILDEKDEYLEGNHIKQRKSSQVKESFLNNLELYSNVLKNCELVDLDHKVDALEIAIEKYCKSIGLLYKIFYDFLFQNMEEVIEEKDQSDVINMLTIGIPLVVQSMIVKNVGTPKLKVSIENLIPKAKTEFEKLTLICLLGDLRSEGYITHFEEIFESTQSSLIKEIIRAKLFYYQSFYSMPKEEEKRLINLFAETLVEKQYAANASTKGQLKQALMKYELLNKQKKILE